MRCRSTKPLLAVQPEQPQVLNNLACIALKTGDEAKALDYARRAAALAPQDPAITDGCLAGFWCAPDVRRNPAVLSRSAVRDAGNSEIRYRLGVALMQLGRKAEARRQFEQAIAVGWPILASRKPGVWVSGNRGPWRSGLQDGACPFAAGLVLCEAGENRQHSWCKYLIDFVD